MITYKKEVLRLKISKRPWSEITEADYEDAESFCKACLIDLNEGPNKTKENCKLPIYEPNGALNINAVYAAAAALAGARGGVKAPPEEKRRAARKLIQIYHEVLERPAPDSLYEIAGVPKPKKFIEEEE